MTPKVERVRPCTDPGAFLKLLHRAFAGMNARIDPPSSLARLAAEDIVRHAEEEYLLAVLDRGQPVACLFAKRARDHLYLGKLATDIDYRGYGYARALIDRAAMIAKANRVPKLVLETRVELTENHATFAALGFSEVGRTAHPGYDRPTSLTMERIVL